MTKPISNTVIILLILAVIALSGCIGYQGQEIPKTTSPDGVTTNPTGEAVQRQSIAVGPSDLGIPISSGYESGTGIVVSGSGKMSVTPDVAVFTVGVVNTAEDAKDAASTNAETMDAVIKAIKAMGIEERDIQTRNVNLYPEFDYGTRDERKELPVIIGYRAENRVTVTIREIESTGEVIDSVTAAGANQIYGLTFTVSDEANKGLRAQILREAVLDATDKAQAIADALGAKRITPIKVVEGGGYSPPMYKVDVATMEQAGAPTPVSPGEVDLTASVTVTFDFEY